LQETAALVTALTADPTVMQIKASLEVRSEVKAHTLSNNAGTIIPKKAKYYLKYKIEE